MTAPVAIAMKVLGSLALSASMFVAVSQAVRGPVSLVITSGSSMEPSLKSGDLVLVRRGEYRVGDVVAYRSASLKSIVLHRIIETHGNRFVFKGDNNDWLDSDRPTPSDLVGKRVLRIPLAGRLLASLRSAAGIGAAGAVAVYVLLRTGKRRRRTRSVGATMQRGGGMTALRLGKLSKIQRNRIVAAAGGVCIVLTIAAFLLPAGPRSAPTQSFRHAGTFTYSARVPQGPVYEKDVITTGDPVYLQLVPSLDVSFTYRFRSQAEHSVEQSTRFVAEVSDDSGWKRTFAIQETRIAAGDESVLRGRLNLAKIWRTIGDVQRLTGVRAGSYALALVPTVRVTGTVAGVRVDDEFAPRFAMQLDALLLRALRAVTIGATDDPPPDPRTPVQDGSVATGSRGASVIAFGPVAVSAAALRVVGASGSVLAMLVLLLGATKRTRAMPGREDEARKILRTYREWIVPVSTPVRSDGNVVDVASMDGLVRLADRYDRMVLLDDEGCTAVFFVEDHGTAYRYVAQKAQPAAHTRDAVVSRDAHFTPAFEGGRLG
ncbi:MAG TPA: signal peptidase I [Actinomycetota bacterium]|nr:signal peptidase I [Actinomycetota bacterium]